jgi:hypothetical protein
MERWWPWITLRLPSEELMENRFKVATPWERHMTRVGCALAVAIFSLVGSRLALADECDAAAANLAMQIGASVIRRSEANMIFLKHPKIADIHVGCPMIPTQHPDLWMAWDDAAPPAWFFDLAAHAAGILSGASEPTIRRGAIACWQAALRSKDEMSDITSHGVTYQCQAFVRDGGGTALDIFKASTEGN